MSNDELALNEIKTQDVLSLMERSALEKVALDVIKNGADLIRKKNNEIQSLQSQLKNAEEVILSIEKLSTDKILLLNLTGGQFTNLKHLISDAHDYFKNKDKA